MKDFAAKSRLLVLVVMVLLLAMPFLMFQVEMHKLT